MKGKIPITEKIILESDESQWRMLTRGLINELKTSGLIEMSPKKNVRVRLKILKIIPPEIVYKEVASRVESNEGDEANVGLSRILNFLTKTIEKKSWIFIGFIEGETKTPIIISHYPSLNLSIYSQKKKSENKNTFLPLNSLN